VADSHDHSHNVDIWMREAANDLSADQLLQLSERAMAALWNRTYFILGEVTLTAITDRVLYNASEEFPPFELLKLEPSGINWQGLREQHEALDEGELTEGIRFVLTEFMAVIGNLTAEILTPALYAELSKVTLKGQAPSGEREKGRA
jgi:hypothetical protein